jgi:transcriptional regulator with XRE-family HTH domain
MPRHKQQGIPDLGALLEQHMRRQGLELSELAARSGISLSYLARIHRGEVTNPTIAFVLRLAGAFGLTVSELLGEEEPDDTPRTQGDVLREMRQRLQGLQRLLDELERTPGEPGT